MVRREAHTAVNGGRSLREINRERKAQSREWKREEEARRQEAIANYLDVLNDANTNLSLTSALEVVHPKTRLQRLASTEKDKIIPGETGYKNGKSTMGGWVEYYKRTSHYLLLEEAAGYIVELNIGQGRTYREAILQDGSVGVVLEPCKDGSQTYTCGAATVLITDWSDSFENRNTLGIWGPSVITPENIKFTQATRYAEALGNLIVVQESAQ